MPKSEADAPPAASSAPAPVVPPAGLRISGVAGEGKGRCLVATRHFAPGSLIATFDDPLVAIPDRANGRSTCHWCLREGVERGSAPGGDDSFAEPDAEPLPVLSACTACDSSVYCSKACQAAAWKRVHSLECKAMRRVRARAGRNWMPMSTRAATQLLLRAKRGDRVVLDAVGDVPSGKVVPSPTMLEGSFEYYRRDRKLWSDGGVQGLTIATYAGMEKPESLVEVVRELVLRIQTNSFSRADADQGDGGLHLDPVLAMANHSCVPNAFVYFDGRQALLRAVKEIFEGDEVEIPYIDISHTKPEREKALKAYGFSCQCSRCRYDLDVYQVCETSSLISMNKMSVQPDLQKYLNPPIDRQLYQSVANNCVWDPSIAERFPDPLSIARHCWPACKGLIQARMFAVEPVPTTLQELTVSYIQKGRFDLALSVACFLAIQSHPYAHVAPFHAPRLKGIVMIASLLHNTAPMTVIGELAKKCSHKRLVSVLSECDQLSIAEAMCRIALHYGPLAHSKDWMTLRKARSMLEDIESIPNRQRETTMLKIWVGEPEHPAGKDFVGREVLGQINRLASFALEIASAELDSGGRAIEKP